MPTRRGRYVALLGGTFALGRTGRAKSFVDLRKFHSALGHEAAASGLAIGSPGAEVASGAAFSFAGPPHTFVTTGSPSPAIGSMLTGRPPTVRSTPEWGGHSGDAPHLFAIMQTQLRDQLLSAGYTEILILRLACCGCDWRTFRRVQDDREYPCPRCAQPVKAKVLGAGFTRRQELPFEQTAWPLRYRGLDPAPVLRRKRRSQDARHHAGNQYTDPVWE